MATKSKKAMPVFSYLDASRAVLYVRLILGSLREHFVAAWHLYRVAGYDAANPSYRDEMRYHREEALAALEELAEIGVLPYERANRGIALFPFIVLDGGTPRQAYFVYKDSRDMIDSYVLNDELCDQNDLYGSERPMPEEWKKPGAVAILEQEGP